MSLIVIVEGREAVPVRAIAFLTDWRELQPESLARQLSDDDEVGLPGALVAHRLHSAGHVVAIPARWWIEKRREIQAISEEIRAVQAGHESGRQRWRREATHVLPAGVFVWKSELDDFVSRMIAYQQLGPAGVPSEHSRGEDAGDDHPGSPWAKERAALSRQIEARYRLDYEALVLPELQVVIGEGFEAGASSHQKDGADTSAAARLMDEIEQVSERLAALECSGRQSSSDSVAEHQHLLHRLRDLERRKQWMRGDSTDPVAFREGFLCTRIGSTVWDRWKRFSSVSLEHAAQLLDEVDPDEVPHRSPTQVMLSTLIEATGDGRPRRLDEWLRALVKFEGDKKGTSEARPPLAGAKEIGKGTAETQEQRQARRYQACIDSGLVMPTSELARLPAGLKRVAEAEGVTRQTFTQDIKAHIARLNGR